MKLLISGGFPKIDHAKQKEGFRYEEAYWTILDWENGSYEKEVRFKSSTEYYPVEFTQQFKAGHQYGEIFVVPSNCEILIYDLKNEAIKTCITHPSFTDLHHVVIRNDCLYVVNTGIEAIQIFNMQGKLIDEYALVDNPTWKSLENNSDMRLIASTKPHYIHPNYVFFINGEPWVTRFQNKDAVSLFNSSEKINLNYSNGRPHDGHIVGEFIYFTLTDGYVVVINKENKKLEELINLNEIHYKNKILGWCRGVEILGEYAYVGFSGMRRSKFVEYAAWAVRGKERLPARVSQYNIHKKELSKEVLLGNKGGAIFTVKELQQGFNII